MNTNRLIRNHLEILKEIIDVLEGNGLEIEQILLENEISSSATDGEICMKCSSLLLSLNEQKENNKIIGRLTSELIEYCHINGFRPNMIKN